MKKNKKYSVLFVCTVCLLLCSNLFLLYQKDKQNQTRTNQAIGSLIAEIQETYPNVKNEDIIKILNSDNSSEQFTLKYGIDLHTDSILKEDTGSLVSSYLISSCMIIFFSVLLACLFYQYQNKEKQKTNEIIKLLEEINQKNYTLGMDSNDESDLSILKNELYKTTITLKEESENAKNDKNSIKQSLEDISHQLKTPLTSINILLDNLLDDPEMSPDTRLEFIRDIRRETMNINFLIQTLLKLSRFDANAVEYNNQEYSLKDIVDKAVQNNMILSDLMDVKMKTEIPADIALVCDLHWQSEALTNIIKDSLEHSYAGDSVLIDASETKLYTEVRIQDHGSGMCEEDRKHIFDRFYRGKNSSKEGIGIGLSLAKNIIEKNQGKISVESAEGKGTVFTIRYFRTMES